MADRIKWCHVCETAGDEEDLKELERALPPGYQHLVCAFKAEEQRVVLKVKLTLREQVENWLKDFQLSSSLTWRKARTYPESGRYNTYRADFRCQHNTYGAERSPKNTNCRATLFLVLKRSMEDRRSRSTDRHMVDGYLLYVNWRNNHNHLIVCGQAPSKRGVSTTTQERLTNEGDSNSTVPISSGTTWHNVNPVLRCCTCPVGVSGASCKHQRAVLRAVDVMEAGPASRTPELRRLFYEISCGGPTPEKWCEGSDLQGPVVEQNEHEVADDDNNGHRAGTSPKTISDASTECPKRRLEHFVDSLKRKLDTDNSFTAPVNAFVDTFDELKTDSALQSSLFSFGKRQHGHIEGLSPDRRRHRCPNNSTGTEEGGLRWEENHWSCHTPQELKEGARVLQAKRRKLRGNRSTFPSVCRTVPQERLIKTRTPHLPSRPERMNHKCVYFGYFNVYSSL